MADPPAAPPAPTQPQNAEERLASAFTELFGRPPQFVAGAPGRVNLLGEHTDYNGLPVLPMAIDRRVRIAGASRGDLRVCLRNTRAGFGGRDFEIGAAIAPFPSGDWGNYVKAAAQGLVRHLADNAPQARLTGADLLVDGDIPSGAGLSSSSALVVAAALALLAAAGEELPPATLAEILPAAERYVGTLSGGMDQAISLLGRAGQALRIDFFPVRVRPVPLPPGCSVVVCHSLVRAEKSGAARRAYNRRVVECRIACRLIEAGLTEFGSPRLRHLGDLAGLFPAQPLGGLVGRLSGNVPDGPLGFAEIAAALGASAESVRRACDVPEGVEPPFYPLRRLRHVLTEADRVDAAEEALRAGDAGRFGRLMDASHASCRDDYEISCPELDALVAAAKEAGALGARLTGAGFGGCTVNLLEDARVPDFLRHVEGAFYSTRLGGPVGESEHCFSFHPSDGASVSSLSAGAERVSVE